MTDQLAGFGVGIAIINHTGSAGAGLPALLMRLAEDGHEEWVEVHPAEHIPPTLTVPDDVGRALLDSLVRHYHGAEDTRALRKDYDDERSRNDRLTGTLATMGEQLARDVGRALTEPPATTTAAIRERM
ncbi:MAG: hypothetical protein JWO67_6390 [Streptosporangiaceae bacterium]|nr:hypothetical protein [Streptosporangiaceae bacterium]